MTERFLFTRYSITGVLVLCCLVLAALSACRDRGEQPGRVLILGIDGLDPDTIDLLISEGRLPNFAKLRQDGASGTLLAQTPLLSPVLWTTIATGKTPDQHGIGHFIAVDPLSGAEMPATSTMRRVPALWGIASQHDRTVATVGWWASWPPEPVNGVVVSDHTCYHFLFHEAVEGGSQTAVTYPAEVLEEITPLIRRPADISYEQAARFIDVQPESFAEERGFEDKLSHLRWALATAESYRDIGLELWQRRQPDLLMVYIEGTDSISHLFGHLFRATGLQGELAEQQQKYGRAAEETYRFADELLGRYLQALDERTTLLVMSDHGFALGELQDDPSRTRDLRRIASDQHRRKGILSACGNRVKRSTRFADATQLDITPTVLALLGIDVAQDMPGRVLHEGFAVAEPPRRVASYERSSQPSADLAGESGVNEQIRSHLEALGYLDTGEVVSPQGSRNLAAVHFSKGEYEKAAEVYSQLIEEEPGEAALYNSLAGCLGAMGRYDEALQALTKGLELDPLHVPAYHNRAVLHERSGNVEAAIADYRSALRYNSQYEPSRQALVRLTGSAEVTVPVTDTERKAEALAQRAAEAARHGAYDDAMSLLAEAEKVAPDFVLVYQYQSNVAYLMNDFDAAERALVKALELEPENELYRQNLDRVRRMRARAEQQPGSDLR